MTKKGSKKKKRVLPELSHELLITMYRGMYQIRHFELKVNELFLKGYIPGTIHLSHGQEAVPVGVCAHLHQDDYIIPTHRGHGHALAKGMEPESLFAELFARKTGCSQGKGGSLHIGDMSIGIAPGNPVVGSSVPVAAGMALAFKKMGTEQIAVSFFGDGAVNTGPLHEGINLAAIWKLPVAFVCENNHYAISTHVEKITLLDRLVERAVAYGIPGVHVDGNDVIAVYQAAAEAIQRARAGEGPTFLECLTYRQGGHKRDDAASYRPKEEVERWLKLDPLPKMRHYLLDGEILSQKHIEELEAEVLAVLDAAVEKALAGPPADPEVVLADVYA
jgi:TPP-dependent pyruvate/acetoin dehydrogenase alpha subunit